MRLLAKTNGAVHVVMLSDCGKLGIWNCCQWISGEWKKEPVTDLESKYGIRIYEGDLVLIP